MNRLKLTAAWLATALFAAGPSFAQSDGQLAVSAGAEYMHGDFGGADDTDVWTLPFGTSYEAGSWYVNVSVPYIHIDGPGRIVGAGDGPVVVTGPAAIPHDEEGLGDVMLRGSYLIRPSSPYIPFVELGGQIKFPTAEEDDGLGTGQFDYTLRADLYQTVGKVSPYIMVGYRFRGHSARYNVKDGVIASFGVDYRIKQAWTAGMAFDFRGATTVGAEDGKELVPHVTWRPSDEWSLNLYGIVGLSDGSADAGAGLQIKYYVP